MRQGKKVKQASGTLLFPALCTSVMEPRDLGTLVTGSEMMRLCVDFVTLGEAGGGFVRVTYWDIFPTSSSIHSYPPRFNDPSIRSAHHPSNLPACRSLIFQILPHPPNAFIQTHPDSTQPSLSHSIHSISGPPKSPRSKNNPIAEEHASIITQIAHHSLRLIPSHHEPDHDSTRPSQTPLELIYIHHP